MALIEVTNITEEYLEREAVALLGELKRLKERAARLRDEAEIKSADGRMHPLTPALTRQITRADWAIQNLEQDLNR